MCDFSAVTKRQLAERSAYRCNRPDCRAYTIAPHPSDPTEVLRHGDAAHIRGARPGSARHDETQPPSERAAITNGIWLCPTHHRIVDADGSGYTVEDLVEWKTEHEHWLSTKGGVPGFPAVTWTTFDGLLVSLSPTHIIDEETSRTCRDHEIRLHSSTRHELRDVALVVQLTEGLVGARIAEGPAGADIRVVPNTVELLAGVTGGGSVTIHGAPPPPLRFTIELQRLTPDRAVRILFRTSSAHAAPPRPAFAVAFSTAYRQYILGSYNYDVDGAYPCREFFVALNANSDGKLVAAPPEERGDQRLVESQIIF